MTESRISENNDINLKELFSSGQDDLPKPGAINLARKKRQFKSGVLATDISSGSFRFVLLTRKKDITVVHRYGILDKSKLGIDSSDPMDLYRAGLAWVDANSSIRARDILVVTSQIDFFIRKLELPLTKRSDLERAARWNIDKRIPIKADDSYLKIQRKESRGKISDLTVGVVPRGQIDNWQFLDKKLVGIVPTPVSLIPMGPPAISKELSYCYIYRHNSYLCIGFYCTGGLQFQHQVAAGFSESDSGDDYNIVDPSKIVVDLANSVEVFYSHFPNNRVAGIVLFMSPEEISELAPVISENIVIDVLPADEPENLKFDESCDPADFDFSYYPLLGAARIEDDDFIFLPKALKDNIVGRKIRKTVYYGVTAGIVAILLLFMFMFAGVNIKKTRLRSVLEQKANIENSRAYTMSREFLERTGRLVALESNLAGSNVSLSKIYTELQYIVPPGIYLKNFDLNNRGGSSEIKISGYYEGDLSRADVTLLALLDNLKDFGLRKIKLERQGQKISGDNKTANFTVTGEMAPNE